MSPRSPRIAPKPPLAVEILTFPAVQVLDVAGPLQVFTAVNEQAAERGAPPVYTLRVIGPAASVGATAGLVFATEPLSGHGVAVDTLVVAGGQGVMRASEDANLVAWVRDRAAQARRVASVCTGAFLLGAAGLLDGRRAVTHWQFCDRLAQRYPAVRVESDPIFIHDEPVWSSAGITAGIDLCLALVEQDCGRAAALAVARQLVVFLKRPGGQAQFSSALDLQSTDDRFARLHDWMVEHLAEDLSLGRLAAKAGMSERSFGRHYRLATGLTPARAVERLRVEAARQLLSETGMPIKRIADRCGFGTEETMRRSFQRIQGVSPQDFRDRFTA